MTSPLRLPAFRLDAGAGAQWLGVFLSRLAERLHAVVPREALLIEQWWDGHAGEVHFLPFSEPLVLAMEALREGIPLPWTRSFRDRACAPPSGWPEAWVGVVEKTPATNRNDFPVGPGVPCSFGSRAGDRSVHGPAPETFRSTGCFLPPDQPFWVGLQTHWRAGPNGEVWATTRGRLAATTPDALRALASALEVHLREVADLPSGSEIRLPEVRPGRRVRRNWATGARPAWESAQPHRLLRDRVPWAAPLPLGPDPQDEPRLRHTVVLGASGSGKTAALAHFARQAVTEGRSVILFDVHGDLAPLVVNGLPAEGRSRVIGIDVVGQPPAIPGLSVFGPVPAADREALVAHLVAAFKRLSTENGETFWGFRLERLFETFLHIVQEQGGDLVDLWSLLTDARRREAARLATGRPELAQFLEELDGIVRRQPEFLWPAASRVAKVVGSPLLTALLAPGDRSPEIGTFLRGGGSAIWRLPMGELGPEGVTFAVTLLLTRVYLEVVRHAVNESPRPGLRLLFVLDEAHLFPARLLSEIVAEGRKFGLGLILATQYPARLAPELRDALTGAAGTVYLFRVPWASAALTGSWAGIAPGIAERVLPTLPPGWAMMSSTGAHADRRLVAMPSPTPPDAPGWHELVRGSAERYGSPVPYREDVATRSSDSLEEDLLLGLVALHARGEDTTRTRLLRWMQEDDAFDPVLGLQTLDTLRRRGWIREAGEQLLLSSAGADRVGVTARTSARTESVEHRALLVAALRIFARHHERLEILRQGRFDTRLPDGRVAVLPPGHRRWGPAELASYLDRRRRDWIWRAFGGRDVHVEAEVSGAARRERIERDWEKARDAGAFLLCLVSGADRARSVRRFLSRAEVPPSRATVWTLRSVRELGASASAT